MPAGRFGISLAAICVRKIGGGLSDSDPRTPSTRAVLDWGGWKETLPLVSRKTAVGCSSEIRSRLSATASTSVGCESNGEVGSKLSRGSGEAAAHTIEVRQIYL